MENQINIIKVRDLTLGDGDPKICIPVTASNKEELKNQVSQLLAAPCDLVEWRVDFYNESQDYWLMEALQFLRGALGEIPLLFTFRTKEEGGEKAISLNEYKQLNLTAAASGLVDLVDVELNRGEELMEELTAKIQSFDVKVIGSYHDFGKTPDAERIVKLLTRMQDLGVDVTKSAFMPQTDRDVLNLLDASLKMKERYADRPYITMSMSRTGGISRLAGRLTGSAVTFATAGKASAPGQMDAAMVRSILCSL